MKNPALLYEVSFFSALWMVLPESWKRSCPNFYAHDCKSIKVDFCYISYLRPNFRFELFFEIPIHPNFFYENSGI